MGIKIVTDSTCDISMDLKKELDIEIVPLTVIFGDKEYADGIDISKKEFYELMRSSESLPKTSQVTPLAFEEVFKKILDEGDEVLGIFISSELSGTYQSATIAKSTLGDDKIHLIDSETTTFGLAALVYEAIRLRDNGNDIDSTIMALEELKKKVVVYAAIENLTYLKKGGRLSSVGATIGTMLNLKPIVEIKHGKINAIHKSRGYSKALDWIIKKALEVGVDTSKPVYFGHSDAFEKAENFSKSAHETIDIKESKIIDLGITVGTHGGPGCVGLGFFTK